MSSFPQKLFHLSGNFRINISNRDFSFFEWKTRERKLSPCTPHLRVFASRSSALTDVSADVNEKSVDKKIWTITRQNSKGTYPARRTGSGRKQEEGNDPFFPRPRSSSAPFFDRPHWSSLEQAKTMLLTTPEFDGDRGFASSFIQVLFNTHAS